MSSDILLADRHCPGRYRMRLVANQPIEFLLWLSGTRFDLTLLEQHWLPCAEDLLAMEPVSSVVNNARNETSECLAPPDSVSGNRDLKVDNPE